MAEDMPVHEPHPFVFHGSLTYEHGLSTSDSGFGESGGQHGHVNEAQHPDFLSNALTGSSGPSESDIFLIDGPQTSASTLHASSGVGQGGSLAVVPNDLFDGSARFATSVPAHVNPVTESPAQAITIDGLVSTFRVTNIMPQRFEGGRDAMSSQGPSAVPTRFSAAGFSHDVPIILNFTTGQIARNCVPGPCLPNAGATVPGPTLPTTRRSRARQPHTFDADAPPVQGPLAPPQRQGAPLDYKRFGRCDGVCQYCHALFWPEEKRSGMSASATPQYQRCCAEGLIEFLNNHNALVHLFRTARDKLREADIPEFQIRLFGVVGGNQYELPTADTIGAIVYDGGPETMTDYDVVIQQLSRTDFIRRKQNDIRSEYLSGIYDAITRGD
ncbi:hypothetical protein CTI12_AA392700 [Artemisia annua]|uniref:Helitron helicase-like domain-containing protein n=1 Tax=Artemisia annua TaxID=35608 RepID=A0A2U1MDH7_ARTAN|nr:hypothetical protein CTI12_AA392700 [Artemisia annua]